jgi:hypothetical protein
MMTSRHKDFDAFFAEVDTEPVCFDFKGRKYELPPELPASVALRALALKGREAEEEVGESELVSLATDVLGQATLEGILADNVSVGQLGEIIKWVLAQYAGSGEAEAGADPGNSLAPETAGVE